MISCFLSRLCVFFGYKWGGSCDSERLLGLHLATQQTCELMSWGLILPCTGDKMYASGCIAMWTHMVGHTIWVSANQNKACFYQPQYNLSCDAMVEHGRTPVYLTQYPHKRALNHYWSRAWRARTIGQISFRAANQIAKYTHDSQWEDDVSLSQSKLKLLPHNHNQSSNFS